MGLSGGIDSAIVCALACRALGAENVMAVLMPSKYSSDHWSIPILSHLRRFFIFEKTSINMKYTFLAVGTIFFVSCGSNSSLEDHRNENHYQSDLNR